MSFLQVSYIFIGYRRRDAPPAQPITFVLTSTGLIIIVGVSVLYIEAFKLLGTDHIISRSLVRRVKCDETFPLCHNCTSTGRKCDGYEFVPTHHATTFINIHSGLSELQLAGHLEHRAFQYFHLQTSLQLAGVDDHQFWREAVIPVACVDPGVRHAVVALACLHEQFVEGRTTCDRAENRFALEQYNLAIKSHLNVLGKQAQAPSIELNLIPCLLFILIEMLRVNFTSASVLIKRAADILDEHNTKMGQRSIQASSDIFDRIKTLLTRMEAQVQALIGPTCGSSVRPPILTKARTSIPEVFTSISEAQFLLEYYQYLYNRSESGVIEQQHSDSLVNSKATILNLDNFDQITKRWTVAFQACLEARASPMGESELFSVRVLEVYHMVNSTFLDAMSHNGGAQDPMVWDSYSEVFSQAMTLIESLHQALTTPAGPKEHKPIFTLDLGIVGILFDIALMCREPLIRRRAVLILFAWHRREGMWDSVLAANIAERVIAIEEDGQVVLSCSDVPARQRVKAVVPSFDLDRKSCSVTYMLNGATEVTATFEIQ